MQPLYYTFSNKIRILSKILAFLAVLHLICAILFLSGWGFEGGTEDDGAVLIGFSLLGIFVSFQLSSGKLDAGIYFLFFYILCLCTSLGISTSLFVLFKEFISQCGGSVDAITLLGVLHVCPESTDNPKFDFLQSVCIVTSVVLVANMVVAFILLYHVYRELRKVMIPQHFDSSFVRTKTKCLLFVTSFHTVCGVLLACSFSNTSTIIGISVAFCGALGVISAIATLKGRFTAAKGCLQLYYFSCVVSFLQSLFAATFVYLISKSCRGLRDSNPPPSSSMDVQVLGQTFRCGSGSSVLHGIVLSFSVGCLPVCVVGYFLAKNILSNIVLVLQPPDIAAAARRFFNDQGSAAVKIWNALDDPSGHSVSVKSPRIVGLGHSISPPPSPSPTAINGTISPVQQQPTLGGVGGLISPTRFSKYGYSSASNSSGNRSYLSAASGSTMTTTNGTTSHRSSMTSSSFYGSSYQSIGYQTPDPSPRF